MQLYHLGCTTCDVNPLQDDAVSCLVIGTESGQLLVLDPTGTQVLHTWQIKHVPASLCAAGE